MGGRLKNFGVVLVGLVTLLLCESAALGSPTETIQGKVTGQFASASGCLGCGDMTRYVKADRVWCAWQGDNVIIGGYGADLLISSGGGNDKFVYLSILDTGDTIVGFDVSTSPQADKIDLSAIDPTTLAWGAVGDLQAVVLHRGEWLAHYAPQAGVSRPSGITINSTGAPP